MALATWAWWCCTATCTAPAARSAYASRRRRVQIVRDDLGPRPRGTRSSRAIGRLERGDRVERFEVADVRPEVGRVVRRRRRTCSSDGRRRRARAVERRRRRDRRAERSRASGEARRAARDHARRPSRRSASAISRSWTRKTSAMPTRAASSASALRVAIGSSERLPEVMTSGRPPSASSRWCSGV